MAGDYFFENGDCFVVGYRYTLCMNDIAPINEEIGQEELQPKPNRLQRFFRAGKRITGLLLLIYVGLVLFLYLFQNRLIFPGQNSQRFAQPVVQTLNDDFDHLVSLTTGSGKETMMQIVRCSDSNIVPDSAILFFYGNRLSMAECRPVIDALVQPGVIVAVPDYIGYGVSPGRPSEKDCYETADVAYNYLVNQEGMAPEKILIVGYSIGTGVACDLASRCPNAGLVMIAGFSSLADAARQFFPFLPINALLRYRFDSINKLERVESPILFIHGDCDTVVGYRLGCLNHETALKSGKKTQLETIHGARHDVVFETSLICPIIERFRKKSIATGLQRVGFTATDGT